MLPPGGQRFMREGFSARLALAAMLVFAAQPALCTLAHALPHRAAPATDVGHGCCQHDGPPRRAERRPDSPQPPEHSGQKCHCCCDDQTAVILTAEAGRAGAPAGSLSVTPPVTPGASLVPPAAPCLPLCPSPAAPPAS